MPSFNLFGIGIQAINLRGLGTESPEIDRNCPHQIAKNPEISHLYPFLRLMANRTDRNISTPNALPQVFGSLRIGVAFHGCKTQNFAVISDVVFCPLMASSATFILICWVCLFRVTDICFLLGGEVKILS